MLSLMVHNVLCGGLGDCIVLLSQHIPLHQTECSKFELKGLAAL